MNIIRESMKIEEDFTTSMKIMGLLYGQGIPKGKSIKNKILSLICLQRPAIAIMGPLMFFAAAIIALERIPSLESIVIGSIAVYLLTSAEHTIDDTIDKEIDKKKWPDRPLPSEIISRRSGAYYAISLAALGIILTYIFFNWQLVVVELVALGLGTLYPYLRDRIGYLVLAPIPPLIAVGGWVAFSPDTLFTSPIPWVLYLVFAFWQAFHILTLPWAINVAKTFLIKPKPRSVVLLSVVFSVVTLIFAIYLATFFSDSLIFIITMLVISVIFWISAVPLIKEPTNIIKSLRATMVATNYNIVMCAVLLIVAV
ncbi:MAG: UbiA prenyltransferase family protein [Thermoplasmata archaeon]|nr:MAG: UbiA prenyltransferase family protein [Thermoplasmata archaeon]